MAVTEETSAAELAEAVAVAEFVFHLAGVNRPLEEREFTEGNLGFTETLCALLAARGIPLPIVFSSSTQAELNNPYGHSKLLAEGALLDHGRATGSPVRIFRLTNVFGKWSRPNYNSAVATFCHNIARGLPITISNSASTLRLVYVDDVIVGFLAQLESVEDGQAYVEAGPIHVTTVGEVASLLEGFRDSRTTLLTNRVGKDFIRKLYATFMSFLPPSEFAYQVPTHRDPRGEFVEMLRTPDCGQFSYFTAKPGVTRGEHYHHSKTEKFLVIRGLARFEFRNIQTGETCKLAIPGGEGRIVETAPGWAHNITNIGEDELMVMLWANELFDPLEPDTFAMKVMS
jgi:UDP-2-acetamido-2,6-beta-L-arabino-hexul-4-ose reductase